MKWAEQVVRMGEVTAYKTLAGRLEGKRSIGRPGCRWEGNVEWILGK